jgi:acetyltransferase-like isoleucine patch superfamily enzyme
MNWRYYFSDIKYILTQLSVINLFNTIRAKIKNQGGGNVYINHHTSLLLAKTGVLQVPKGAKFHFNQYWHQKDYFPGWLAVHEQAELQVTGDFTIYSGARVSVNAQARLVLGSGYINHGLNLNCFTSIEIGDDVAISENVTIRDSDNHEMVAAGFQKTLPIKIGNHVWIGMNVTILKGVTIGDGAVIAAGAVVNKNIPARCLAGGVPARVMKENVAWQ